MADSASHVYPRCSMVPGRKFSTRTSAFLTMDSNKVRSSSCFRLRAMLCLPRLTKPKYNDLSSRKGPNARESSPEPGRSTLMTRAPRSLSSMVQNGPARTWDRSMTTIPSNGPFEPPLVAPGDMSDHPPWADASADLRTGTPIGRATSTRTRTAYTTGDSARRHLGLAPEPGHGRPRTAIFHAPAHAASDDGDAGTGA